MPIYQEIPFEYLLAALETTRGTAATAPTHYLPFTGTLKEMEEVYYPDEASGSLEEYTRSVTTRRWGELEGEGGADVNYLPFLFNLGLAPLTTPITPAGATLGRLWEFTPNRRADNIKAATVWSGDPNVTQVQRATYGLLQEIAFEADSSSTDGVTMSVKGISQMPTLETPPVEPTVTPGPLLIPGAMQLWLDDTSAIGTSDITERFVKADITIPTGAVAKFGAKGPTTDKSFRRIGRQKSHPELNFEVEVSNDALSKEYASWRNGKLVKIRWRLNGDYIEDVSSAATYQFLEFDFYGRLTSPERGELENVNRTMAFAVMGIRNATLGTSVVARVQNTRTTL